MSKHTTGPWATEGFEQINASTGNFYGGLIVSANGEDIVAQCVMPRDAILIAAAPDLLEALEVILRDHMAVHGVGDLEMQPALFQARAAIAKATGEQP